MFIVDCAKKLTAVALAMECSEEQILSASVETVAIKIGLDINSPIMQKYSFYEAIIKQHVVNAIYPKAVSTADRICCLLSNATDVTVSEADGLMTIEYREA